jgi:hypothetical protein
LFVSRDAHVLHASDPGSHDHAVHDAVGVGVLLLLHGDAARVGDHPLGFPALSPRGLPGELARGVEVEEGVGPAVVIRVDLLPEEAAVLVEMPDVDPPVLVLVLLLAGDLPLVEEDPHVRLPVAALVDLLPQDHAAAVEDLRRRIGDLGLAAVADSRARIGMGRRRRSRPPPRRS